MTDRLVDFDAARAEREHAPLLLRAYGRTIELPGTMPASVFLDVLEIEARNGDAADVSVREWVGILRRILPGEVLDDLISHSDFSSDDFVELASLVMGAYMGADGEADAGEAPAPNRETRRATKSPRSRGSHAASTHPQREGSPGEPSSNTGTL